MSLIHVPRRRIAQPVGPTGVDARALLGSKVILAVPFNGARAFGRAAGPITFGANGSLAGSAVGLALNGGSSAAIASVPLDLSAYNAITVSALVYLRDVSGPDHMIWELTSDGLATTGGFALYAASGGGKFETGHHGDVGMSATGWLTVPANGTWNHIAVVHDFSAAYTGEMKFFLNGVEKPTYAWDAIPENTAASRFANSTLYFLNRAMSSLPTDAMMAGFCILEGDQSQYMPMLAANPWQLYEPEYDTIFFGAAGTSTTTVTVNAGSLTLTGQSVTDTVTAAVSAGTVALTGQNVALQRQTPVTAGSTSLTGQSIGITITVPISPGTLSLTGSDVTVVPPSGSFNIAVDPGSITLTGSSVTGTITGVTSNGTLSLTGQSIGTTLTVPVIPGTLSLTGSDVAITFLGTQTITVDPGTLTLLGKDVSVSVTGGTKGGAGRAKLKKKRQKVVKRELDETLQQLIDDLIEDRNYQTPQEHIEEAIEVLQEAAVEIRTEEVSPEKIKELLLETSLSLRLTSMEQSLNNKFDLILEQLQKTNKYVQSLEELLVILNNT